MLIIVEGPDKAGKTTLCREIAERFGYDYVHFGAPGPDPAKEYADFLLNLKKPTVCDRFLYGELVYGPLLRGKSIITPLQKTVLERLCRFRGALLIHASTSLELITKRILDEGDPLITVDQNAAAYWAFIKVMREAHIVPFCAYTAHTAIMTDKLVESLIGIVDMMKAGAMIAHNICTGIGTVMGPKTVLVGEELNANVTWIHKPFDRGVSSEFLNDCIISSGIDEARVYTVNAATLRIEEILFLESTGCTKFVALGNKADEVLAYYSVPHLKIAHPQYQKRFKLADREEYIKELAKATCSCSMTGDH